MVRQGDELQGQGGARLVVRTQKAILIDASGTASTGSGFTSASSPCCAEPASRTGEDAHLQGRNSHVVKRGYKLARSGR
jgi:hypothetical protein